MEVKRLQNPKSHFEQQTFDIVSAAVSRKNAEKTTAVLLEESLSCMQIPISPDCNRQQALSDISDERSLADRLLDFSSFPLHSVSDELTDLLNPDCFLSEDAEMSSAVNMLLLDTNPPPKTSPEIEAQVDLYDDVIDNLAEALNDMLPHSSQFTDDEIYAILKEGHVSIILTMSCSLWWFIHVWLQQAFQKKGKPMSTIIPFHIHRYCRSIRTIHRRKTNSFIYGICYSYWKSNVSSCCHEHKITHALLPQKCEIRQKKINMTKHGDSPLSIAV